LELLVSKTCSGDLKAFEEIVGRFQDMAYGYAYSILKDFHLAEDASQEAFIEAYQQLPRLSNRKAFPGWFRRIVFKYCDRILRQKTSEEISMDEIPEPVSDYPDPAK